MEEYSIELNNNIEQNNILVRNDITEKNWTNKQLSINNDDDNLHGQKTT